MTAPAPYLIATGDALDGQLGLYTREALIYALVPTLAGLPLTGGTAFEVRERAVQYRERAIIFAGAAQQRELLAFGGIALELVPKAALAELYRDRAEPPIWRELWPDNAPRLIIIEHLDHRGYHVHPGGRAVVIGWQTAGRLIRSLREAGMLSAALLNPKPAR